MILRYLSQYHVYLMMVELQIVEDNNLVYNVSCNDKGGYLFKPVEIWGSVAKGGQYVYNPGDYGEMTIESEDSWFKPYLNLYELPVDPYDNDKGLWYEGYEIWYDVDALTENAPERSTKCWLLLDGKRSANYITIILDKWQIYPSTPVTPPTPAYTYVTYYFARPADKTTMYDSETNESLYIFNTTNLIAYNVEGDLDNAEDFAMYGSSAKTVDDILFCYAIDGISKISTSTIVNSTFFSDATFVRGTLLNVNSTGTTTSNSLNINSCCITTIKSANVDGQPACKVDLVKNQTYGIYSYTKTSADNNYYYKGKYTHLDETGKNSVWAVYEFKYKN